MDRENLPELVAKTRDLLKSYQCTQADVKSVFLAIELENIASWKKGNQHE